jgi:CHAT domain-containing protein
MSRSKLDKKLIKRRVGLVTWLVLFATVICFIAMVSLAGETETSLSADQRLEEGRTAYRRGSFPQAILHWTQASQDYESEEQKQEQGQALIYLSQALHQIGRYGDARAALVKAMSLAKERGDRGQLAVILGRLGTIYFAVGQNQEALQSLNDAMELSRATENQALTAGLLNDLGNVLAAEDRRIEAMNAYSESVALATAARNELLVVTATINGAAAATQEGHYMDAQAKFDIASKQIPSLNDSHEKAFAWLNLGLGYEGLRQEPSKVSSAAEESSAVTQGADTERREPETTPLGKPSISNEQSIRQAAGSYWAAIKVATALNDFGAESYAWGYLGHLYEQEGRVSEALDLTRRAILAAQQVRAPESLFRWHWQTARLLKTQRKDDEAIPAYRRAINTLQPIRQELLVGGRNRQLAFRETTGPLFFELSDLLLTRARSTVDPQGHQDLLVQAQDTIELFKAAELQDYFMDECVAVARSRSTAVAEGSKTSAVIYPIVLQDRLELLVSLPSGLKQFVVPVKADALTKEVRAFRSALENRTRNTYLPPAQKLYDWLLRPVAPDLEAAGITTLVFVPDGPLRTIPMAPLHDGKDYLVAKYALAITPGLTLTDPRPINRANIKLLSAGLSESVQGFPPLPNVTKELSSIQQLYRGPRLLNDEFRVIRMEAELKEEPFTILHIASHGKVEKEVKNSFILAYDDKITMDRLSQLVGLYQFRNSPLELLTLSACETAAGDDRAALGLAGMAIKAGARSVLATLWLIDDEATSDLITEFYKQLQDPAISKAVALQQAQLQILKDPLHQHPMYWAPFLLINNWL